jgi:hypothetical protein
MQLSVRRLNNEATNTAYWRDGRRREVVPSSGFGSQGVVGEEYSVHDLTSQWIHVPWATTPQQDGRGDLDASVMAATLLGSAWGTFTIETPMFSN